MNWGDVGEFVLFVEGDEMSYGTQDGIYLYAEIVRVTCPICGEEFIGNKAMAGKFLLGHHHYHEFENQHAEHYGGI